MLLFGAAVRHHAALSLKRANTLDVLDTPTALTQVLHLLTPAGKQSYATTESQQKGYRHGQPAPSVVPFTVTPAAALDAFKQFQKDSCFRLHAGNLLNAQHKLEPLFLPFWLFEATISAEAIAILGRRADKSNLRSPLVWAKMSEWKTVLSESKLHMSEPYMQVFASYRIRRDLAEAAKPSEQTFNRLAENAVPLPESALQQKRYPDPIATAEQLSQGQHQQATTESSNNSSSSNSSSTSQEGHVQLDAADMRQAVAWQLCHRQIMHEQIETAVQYLKEHLSADEVKGLQVRLKVHNRSACLMYFPAYHLSYVHGEKYTPSRAEIVPAEYDAVIGGGPDKRVGTELHPSPVKSQAAAAAAVIGVGLGVLPLAHAALGALGIGTGKAAMGGADAALLAVLAAAGAGVLASRLPLIARNRHAAEQVHADASFYKQYDQRETAYGMPPDEHTLWLWKDADWRRWERDEPWSWVPEQRRRWAEDLFRQQAQRDIDRVVAAKHQAEHSQRRQEEEEREAHRERKFGRSRRFNHHGPHEEAGTRGIYQSQNQPRRRRDFLGYYKALGINLEEAGAVITADFIKTHYKAAALRLHPDKHVHADAATQKRTTEQFRRLQLAYEVLKDAEKRKAYDYGRLVQ